MKVVIIAGGQGTRIATVNADIPKAMIPICGKPIIEMQVELAKRYGFVEFLFVIGHLGNQISEYFGDGSKWTVKIEYYQETQPLGTAGALSYLKDVLVEDFYVFYGDTVMDFDMNAMLDFHKMRKADATLFVHPNDHPYDSDIIDMDANGRIKHLFLKPHPDDFISRNIVNAALFIFNPNILSQIEVGIKSHIEKDLFPRCMEHKMRLYGYLSAEYIKDMGTPERYLAVTDDVKSGKLDRLNRRNPRPAVFLDRDGTINKEVHFLNNPDDLELIKGVAEAIRIINQKGYLVIIITNQPVIARGEATFETIEIIHKKLETMLGKENAYLNGIYLCPHHPDKGFPGEIKGLKINCDCRKPKTGLVIQAAKDWNIDLGNSYFIGDSNRDLICGQNAGCKKSILIETNCDNALLNAVKKII